MHAIGKRSFQYTYYLIKSLIFSSVHTVGFRVIRVGVIHQKLSKFESVKLGWGTFLLPCIQNTAFREGTPPLVSPFRTISTIFSKGASYWLLESTRGRRFCIHFYNINAYMALTLDILSLVNNIKIIEFSKICWIGLEFFLVYIYLNYTIYIHTCDTFIPVKIYI